jgi:arabinose-5-phosphate isomerase
MLKVEEVMGFRLGENLPMAQERETVRGVLSRVSAISRRCGAILIVDAEGALTGIFTDADLRRMLEKGNEGWFDYPVGKVMVKNPKSIKKGSLVAEALQIIHQYRIDELPVLDEQGKPIGLIDVQDTVGLKKSPAN